MKLIKPNFEIITQNPNNDGMLKHIELCGRVCYKSEPKYSSAPNSGHYILCLKGVNLCF